MLQVECVEPGFRIDNVHVNAVVTTLVDIEPDAVSGRKSLEQGGQLLDRAIRQDCNSNSLGK